MRQPRRRLRGLDDDLLLALGDHAGAALQTRRLHNELSDAHRAAMRMLADALDARDPILRREAGEAALLAARSRRRLGLDDRETEVIATAALLRDVGHVAIPERILLNPGPLSPDERTLVEMHPASGAADRRAAGAARRRARRCCITMNASTERDIRPGSRATRSRYAARVLAAVDAYSAMIHDRAAPPARSPSEALAELIEGAGTQFDPTCVGALVDEIGQLDRASIPSGRGRRRRRSTPAGLPPLRELTGTDPLTLLPRSPRVPRGRGGSRRRRRHDRRPRAARRARRDQPRRRAMRPATARC